MKPIFVILFGFIMGASTGLLNLPLIPRLICCVLLGIPAAVLGIVVTNYFEKAAKSKNALRQMMYKRLSFSRWAFVISQAIAGMGGNAQGALTQFFAAIPEERINEFERMAAEYDREQSDDPSESGRGRIPLTREEISQIRDMADNANSMIFYPENANPDFSVFATANSGSTPDISEAVAKGDIKSSGKSVSINDVIARIDKELKET